MRISSTILFVLISFQLIGQTKIYTKLGTGPEIESPITLYESEIDKRDGNDYVFNNNMLDLFFAEKIGTAFGGTNDLSLQKYFASLNTTDKSITIGFNFDDRWGDPLRQLDFIFSGGFKFISSDGFSTIGNSENGFNGSNVGAILKVSLIGNGTISYANKCNSFIQLCRPCNEEKVVVKRREIIEAYRDVVYSNANEKVEKYNKDGFKKYKTLYDSISDYTNEFTSVQDKLEKEQKKIYKEIAEEEIKFIKENKLYRWMGDYWISLDAFIPFGNKEFDVIPITDNKPSKEELYNFDVSLSANGFVEWSSGQSLFLKAFTRIYGTNNILLDELKTTSFQTGTVNEDGTSVTVSPLVTAYDTEYHLFVQGSFKIEPAFFIFNNTVGFSPSVEYNFSDRYKATNWKLGIPVSLKDKEGKPKVNFELQWKQVGTLSKTNHIVGVTTSFLFGDLIN